MPAFLNRSYYCLTCQKGYDTKEKHKCNNVCPSCHKIHDSTGRWKHCSDCNRYFKGEDCFDLHKRASGGGTSTCDTHYKCSSCGKTINRTMDKKKNEHVCGETYCKTCKGFFPEGHLCYMMPECDDAPSDKDTHLEEGAAEEREGKIYIFFDFECTQDDRVECDKGFVQDDERKICRNCRKSTCGSYEHKPNLCVAHRVCLECTNCGVTPDSVCAYCGKNEVIFSGSNTTDEFCEWLFSEKNEGAIVLCHNFQGYDSYPILQYLYRNGIRPDIISNGAKIMSLFISDCKIKMIDSLNFLPTALSNLPDMFRFSELCKGHFPHLYNRKENQTMVLDHLPDIQFYNPEAMKPDARAKFLEWYETNRSNSFDFQKELLTYCRSDVDILRRCCLKFRTLFIDMTKTTEEDPPIEPFENCCTIASVCNLVFRTRFLQPDSIAIINYLGYRPEEKQSVKALQWIKWLSRDKRIQHAKNDGEHQIDQYRVDGYYKTEDGSKVVLEFHGCFWHGCTQCYARDTINPVSDMTMGDLYERTLDKQRHIESLGYTYVSKWEHEFDRDLRENSDLRQFVDELDFVTPLQPREAFFGGRTEAFTLFKEASEDEHVKYYDVTSLYPWVNKTGKVPLGHPNIVTEHFDDIQHYEGLIKCRVLPPRGLYLPVLPSKINGKLLFALCRSCAEAKQQTSCRHCDEQRMLTGTWVTDELKKALEKGYTVAQVYEVWHFDKVAQYDPETKTGGVFTEYVNTFLKIKQEASGWPAWCLTEEDKQEYIGKYFEREGITLNYQNIVENKGLRSLAKLMLNSFWGKFGQRPNMPRVKYVTDPSEYIDLLTCDEQEVLGIQFVNDEMVEMRIKNSNEFVETSEKTNVVIAAYTTAQARLKLYSYLEKLETRALYVDTDSAVFTQREGEYQPPLGDYLGDLTDEVPDGDITHFVTGGPKNYAYRVKNHKDDCIKTCCKVRGITLNYKNALKINFDTVKDMVTNDTENESVIVQDNFKIARDNSSKRLLTTHQDKEYKIVFDKRAIQNTTMTSFPYGY